MLTLTAVFGKTAVWGHYTANPREMKAPVYITACIRIYDPPPYTIILQENMYTECVQLCAQKCDHQFSDEELGGGNLIYSGTYGN